jgi:hypothetical protein
MHFLLPSIRIPLKMFKNKLTNKRKKEKVDCKLRERERESSLTCIHHKERTLRCNQNLGSRNCIGMNRPCKLRDHWAIPTQKQTKKNPIDKMSAIEKKKQNFESKSLDQSID